MLESRKLLPETLGCAPPPPRASSWHALCARDHGAPEAGHEPAPSCPGSVCRAPDKRWAWGCFVTSAPAAPQRERWVRRAPWELRHGRLRRPRPPGLPRPRPSPGSPGGPTPGLPRPRPSPESPGAPPLPRSPRGPTPGLPRPRPTPPPGSPEAPPRLELQLGPAPAWPPGHCSPVLRRMGGSVGGLRRPWCPQPDKALLLPPVTLQGKDRRLQGGIEPQRRDSLTQDQRPGDSEKRAPRFRRKSSILPAIASEASDLGD